MQHNDPSSGNGGFSEMDPETIPANMKVEGQDWFAL
jgi:glucose repression regulatory protein TUP1